MSRFNSFAPTGSLMAVLFLSFSGCGQSKPIMEGLVTLDGVPIEKGTIMLIPATGKGQSAGGGIVDGRYRIAASPVPVKVWINAARKDGKMPDPMNPGSGVIIDRYVEYVPDRYNEKTTLEVTITEGLNKHDFALEGETVSTAKQ